MTYRDRDFIEDINDEREEDAEEATSRASAGKTLEPHINKRFSLWHIGKRGTKGEKDLELKELEEMERKEEKIKKARSARFKTGEILRVKRRVEKRL